MLVTWLDQEARADERCEIREPTSLGQCHVIARVRQAIQLAAVWSIHAPHSENHAKPGQSGNPAVNFEPERVYGNKHS